MNNNNTILYNTTKFYSHDNNISYASCYFKQCFYCTMHC